MVRQRLSEEERRHQIQNAAKDVILEKGYENTRMEDIIERSGMSTGGVYHYYKSVYDIFYDIMSEGLDYGEKRNFSNLDKNINTFVEYQLEKIFDDNEYKVLFSILLQGIERNEDLRKMYTELNSKYENKIKTNFEESAISKSILEDEFLVLFVHSLILGYESFTSLGSKELFKKNKEFIKKVIVSYLKIKEEEEE